MSAEGYFGGFGGFYVPEVLVASLKELEREYQQISQTAEFEAELQSLLRDYAGRPTPLYYARSLSDRAGGARIFLKREDLAHTGSHKINNAIGQALLAKRMGRSRVICETGAGQHGVATATACALLDLECEVYMGETDVERQKLNCYRMNLLGAKINVVRSGSRTLKDSINEAMRDYAATSEDTHYLLGSIVGPHPYPTIVRNFQLVIGTETKEQMAKVTGRLPDALVACVGGGSNSIGLFHPFIDDEHVQMFGAEAAGDGIETGKHCASVVVGEEGVLHGSRTLILQDDDGQVSDTSSVAAGLDYPAVGPEHAHLSASKRAKYFGVTDQEAVLAFHLLSEAEGIIPALESAHAVHLATKIAREFSKDQSIVVCLSGRGDKDVAQIAKLEGRL